MKKEMAIPAWLLKPNISSGHWESIQHRARIGSVCKDYEALLPKEHSDETIQRLLDMGVTFVLVHFSKGFGILAEKNEHEMTKEYVKRLKEKGLRTGLYVGDTIIYESFRQEFSDAEQAYQINARGRPVYYGGTQTHRRRGCYNSPVFRRYLWEIVRIGIEEVKADIICWDNVLYWPEPDACRCAFCKKAFVAFLLRRYPQEKERVHRFGHPHVEGMLPPDFNYEWQPPWAFDVFQDPLWQDWIAFKCESHSRILADLRAYIKELNPEACLFINCYGVSGLNVAWLRGIDYAGTIDNVDIYSSEEHWAPQWREDGILITRLRSRKATQRRGRIYWAHSTRHPQGAPGWITNLAEACAVGQPFLGNIADNWEEYPEPSSQGMLEFCRWAKGQKALFTDPKPITEIGVLRSFSSLAYDNINAPLAVLLAEQSCILSRQPWTIVFEDELATMDDIKTLILSGQESLSDELCRQIDTFVKKGGQLLAIGKNGLLDESRRKRQVTGLECIRDALKAAGYDPETLHREEAVAYGKDGVPTSYIGRTEFPKIQSFVEYGKGRVAMIPELEANVSPNLPPEIYHGYYRVINEVYLKPPKNISAFMETLLWLGHDTIRLTAPAWVIAELSRPSSDGRLALHLVNCRVGTEVGMIPVNLRLPTDIPAIKEVCLVSPDGTKGGEGIRVAFSISGGRITFVVPRVVNYTIAILR